MSIEELTMVLHGGARKLDEGELGGVQGVLKSKSSAVMIDFGMPPDRYNGFFNFPSRPKDYLSLALLSRLDLLPSIKGIWRKDYLRHLKIEIPQTSEVQCAFGTHPHIDHVGLIRYFEPDFPIYLHRLAAQVLLGWQLTSGWTENQFIASIRQFDLTNDKYGRTTFANGIEAIIPRNIITVEDKETVQVGDIKTTFYLVDHSTPGSCGLKIETPYGKIGWSGDLRLRGRFPERTLNFVNELADVDILFWEGSLFHFEHRGTEADLKRTVSELVKGKAFAGIVYPPRDFDRITSIYEAARGTGRMLVVPPAQALMLKLLDGADGYPKLDWKYLGILLPRKNKGIIDRDEEFAMELIERDYFRYERYFLKESFKWQDYDEKKGWQGHKGKIQRVSLEDISRYQDRFIVYMPLAQMPEMLEEIQPGENSIYISSIPSPWTPSLLENQRNTINLLKAYGMYDGPKPDYLTPSIMRDVHQVHVTGHLNRDEARELLRQFKCPVVPFHCMNPQDFVDDVASHTRVIVPEKGKVIPLS